MSKSLGNDVSIRNVLDTWGREVALLLFLSAHWRKPVDFTDETLAQAKAQWDTFQNALLEPAGGEPSPEEWGRLEEILDDDFNTPEALALLHDWRRRGRKAELRRALALFGLAPEAELAPAAVVELAEQRRAARLAKDFAGADRLRDEILASGWEVRDESGGYRLVRR
jgi:cysteinyl-tRNA synthetase